MEKKLSFGPWKIGGERRAPHGDHMTAISIVMFIPAFDFHKQRPIHFH